MLTDDSLLAQRVNAVSAPRDVSQQAYSSWTTTYEKDLLSEGYRAPELTVQYMCDLIPESERATKRVLDIGAGTGLVAKGLIERGFRTVDALEPNEAMLGEARKLGLYKNYYLEYITAQPCSLAEGIYDVLTGSGVFGADGHVPHDAILEMIRLVKSGGYIVLVTRLMVLFEDGPYKGMEPLMQKLEKQGQWKCLHRDVVPKFYMDYDGIVWVYQKL